MRSAAWCAAACPVYNGAAAPLPRHILPISILFPMARAGACAAARTARQPSAATSLSSSPPRPSPARTAATALTSAREQPRVAVDVAARRQRDRERPNEVKRGAAHARGAGAHRQRGRGSDGRVGGTHHARVNNAAGAAQRHERVDTRAHDIRGARVRAGELKYQRDRPSCHKLRPC
jgi:hypothetical protein